MVRRLLSLIEREIRGLHEAAYVLAFFSLLSQVLALLRDRTFANLFGAGPELDAYFAAFRIPDLIFAFLTLFVSSFALIPLLSKKNPVEQGELIGSILLVFGVVAALLSTLLYVVTPILVPYLIPGFSHEEILNTEMLARIMLLQPILLGLSSIAAAVVQTSRRFVLFALAPIFYNLGIIVGAVLFYPIMGLQGLAWGVVFGALLHFVVQLIPLVRDRANMPLSVKVERLLRHIIDVVGPSVPRSVALMGNQALLVAFAAVGSLISVGAVSAMTFAYNLQSVPLTVIGVSYASALFPALATLAAVGDMSGFAKEAWTSVKHIFFWLMPATTFFIVLRAHIVRVVLGSGAFSWDDTRLTAAILALFALSLVAQALILIFSRAYYAVSKTALPILFNIGGSIVAGAGAYILVTGLGSDELFRFFVEALFRVTDVPGTAVLMIPAAYSVTMILVAFLFAAVFGVSYGYDHSVGQSVGVSFSASVIGSAVAYAALYAFGPLLPTNTFLGIFAQGLAAGTAGLLAWVVVLTLLRSQELSDILALLKNKIGIPRA